MIFSARISNSFLSEFRQKYPRSKAMIQVRYLKLNSNWQILHDPLAMRQKYLGADLPRASIHFQAKNYFAIPLMQWFSAIETTIFVPKYTQIFVRKVCSLFFLNAWVQFPEIFSGGYFCCWRKKNLDYFLLRASNGMEKNRIDFLFILATFWHAMEIREIARSTITISAIQNPCRCRLFSGSMWHA